MRKETPVASAPIPAPAGGDKEWVDMINPLIVRTEALEKGQLGLKSDLEQLRQRPAAEGSGLEKRVVVLEKTAGDHTATLSDHSTQLSSLKSGISGLEDKWKERQQVAAPPSAPAPALTVEPPATTPAAPPVVSTVDPSTKKSVAEKREVNPPARVADHQRSTTQPPRGQTVPTPLASFDNNRAYAGGGGNSSRMSFEAAARMSR